MIRCPKCGHIHISGPRYWKDSRGEYLRYTCNQCGYHEDKLTMESLSEIADTADLAAKMALKQQES